MEGERRLVVTACSLISTAFYFGRGFVVRVYNARLDAGSRRWIIASFFSFVP